MPEVEYCKHSVPFLEYCAECVTEFKKLKEGQMMEAGPQYHPTAHCDHGVQLIEACLHCGPSGRLVGGKREDVDYVVCSECGAYVMRRDTYATGNKLRCMACTRKTSVGEPEAVPRSTCVHDTPISDDCTQCLGINDGRPVIALNTCDWCGTVLPAGSLHIFTNRSGGYCSTCADQLARMDAGATEVDPHGTSPKEPGSKLDAGKTRMALVAGDFCRALTEVGKVGTFGANKYTSHGWLTVPGGVERYSDAMLRHFMDEARGEVMDSQSGLRHAAHLAWNALARLELMIRQSEEK